MDKDEVKQAFAKYQLELKQAFAEYNLALVRLSESLSSVTKANLRAEKACTKVYLNCMEVCERICLYKDMLNGGNQDIKTGLSGCKQTNITCLQPGEKH